MIFGIDVSFWDGLIDWTLAKQKVNFAFIKAFEYQEDSVFKLQWERSLGNVARGAYYFWRQSDDKTDKARTEAFLKTIGYDKYNGELPPVIDFEDATANRQTALKQMDRLSERIKQVIGKYPIIYCGLSYWKECGGEKLSTAWANAHKVWVSLPNMDYSKTFETDYVEILQGRKLPYIPKLPPFSKIDFIQYTYRGKPSDIPGYPFGKKAIDFNLYLGTNEEFQQLTGTSITDPIITLTDKEKLDILWKQYESTH
jgi:hypothetical protein